MLLFHYSVHIEYTTKQTTALTTTEVDKKEESGYGGLKRNAPLRYSSTLPYTTCELFVLADAVAV